MEKTFVGLALASLFSFGCDPTYIEEPPVLPEATSALGAGPTCIATSQGQVCVNLAVPGNSQAESLGNLWPLQTGSNWKMHGGSRKHGATVPYRLQVKIEAPRMYEGQQVTPVDFVKDRVEGYWGPDDNQNLRWNVVNFGQGGSPWPYLWARGDERYNRATAQMDRRFGYQSLTGAHPAYALFPSSIAPNPTNSGLGNYLISRHQYPNCFGAGCGLPTPDPNRAHVTWFAGVTNAQIWIPYTGGWTAAKRVEYVEMSLGGGYEVPLSAPYTANRAVACRRDVNGLRVHRGVREDWYFVQGLGVAMILTRDIGAAPDDECVYEVVRESLTPANADTYTYLVGHDFNGYDPSWSF